MYLKNEGGIMMSMHSLKEFQEFNEEKFTKRVIFNEGGSTVFVLNFMPGQQLPQHKHPGTEVYLFVVTGNGTFTIDGKETEVKAQDVVHSSGNEDLAFVNSGNEPVSLYVILTKTPSEDYAKNI
jgi:quercetin dioxygenase-like cupin family protein